MITRRQPDSIRLMRQSAMTQTTCFRAAAVLVVLLGWSTTAFAQRGSIHYFHAGHLPPGTIGYGQVLRNDALRGYFQPVEVQTPRGVRVAARVDGQFSTPREDSILVGMQIGPVYQFKVTNIAFAEGAEVFPTIELVNRLYPPPGLKQRFPVPVQLTEEEIRFALEGRYVTRIIYLEDPATALPRREVPGEQRYFDVPTGQDPLLVADRLGRPMAILRMGSRVPDVNDPNDGGAFGSPPLIVYPDQPEAGESSTQLSSDSPAIERRGRHVPRVPLATPTARGFSPMGLQTAP
jgi:hypothetical protein